MSLDEIYALIHFAIGLPLLGLIYFKLIPRVHREDFQQQLFRIRNDLFEFVWRSGGDFHDPAYVDVRNALNGGIRWAEKIDVPTLLVVTFVSFFAEIPESRSPKAKCRILREEIQRARMAMQKHCLWFVWFSFWGAIVFPILVAVVTVRVFAAALAGTFRRVVDQLLMAIRLASRRPVCVFVQESRRIGGQPSTGMAFP